MLLPSQKGKRGVKIPGTNQSGEAVQELRSFDLAFKKLQEQIAGGKFRKAVVHDGLAYVYDHPDMDDLFMMRLEMGSPPELRWMAEERDKISFIIEEDG